MNINTAVNADGLTIVQIKDGANILLDKLAIFFLIKCLKACSLPTIRNNAIIILIHNKETSKTKKTSSKISNLQYTLFIFTKLLTHTLSGTLAQTSQENK